MWFTSAGQAPADNQRAAPPLPLASLSFSIAASREQQQQSSDAAARQRCLLVRPRAPPLPPLPLASVHAAGSVGASKSAEQQHAGVDFPGDYCVHTRSHCPELTGTG
jgi:hypothetical protein